MSGIHPPSSIRLLQRTVRILLECILVYYFFSGKPGEIKEHMMRRGYIMRVPGSATVFAMFTCFSRFFSNYR